MNGDLSKLSDEELDALLAQSSQQPSAGLPPTDVSAVNVQGRRPDGPIVTNPNEDANVGALTDAQLAAALANQNPDMSLLEDVGRSAVTGLNRAASGVVGSVGDLRQLAGQGVEWLGGKALGALQDATGSDLSASYKGSDIGRRAEAESLQAPPTDFTGGWPTSAEVNDLNQRALGPYHDPQTKAGGYAKSIAEFAPGALLPGGPLTKLLSTVGLGAGAEAVGTLPGIEGTDKEPWARAAVGALGGLGIGGVNAVAQSPQRLAGAAIRGTQEADIAAASQLMREAEGFGITLTPAEALQQVTGGATGLGRLQRVVEGTRQGGDMMAPFFAQRPDQVRGAVTGFADTIAPPTANPSAIGGRAQTAAQGSLDEVRRAINDRATPHYDALRGQLLPDADYAPLAADPSYQAALQALRGNPELSGPITGLPDNDLSVVNEVVKQLDTMAEGARQTMANPGGNNRLAGLRGDARTAADAAATNVSPDWRVARDIVSSGRQQVLEPLELGPLGKIAGTNQVPAQTRALYPPAPLEGAAAETDMAMRGLGQPGADLTRQHLVNTLNEATQNLQSGPNQWGGAKYAATIAGNPEQAATLRAGLDVARPGSADEFDRLVEALMATGKREAQGSKTAFNTEDLKSLGDLPPGVIAAGKTGFSPGKWPSLVSDAIREMQFRRNAEELARALMSSPEEAERWLMAARRRAPQSDILPRVILGSSPAAASATGSSAP